MIGWKPKFKDPRVASVRYRCLNPLAELKGRGFPIELYDDRNLKAYSAVIFSKSYDDSHYAMAQELKNRGKGVIFDLCDNHFYNPFGLEHFRLAREQLFRMIALADLVVASTDVLAKILEEESKPRIQPVVIGDAVEEACSDDLPRPWLLRAFGSFITPNIPRDGKFNVLWFGIHGGDNAPYGMMDLLKQRDLLSEINRDRPIRLIVVSNSRKKYRRYIKPFPIETRYVEWGEIPLGVVLRQCDLNIIPISRNPFTLCKSNNRLAMALYAGVPTVADEIPSYHDLAPFCVLNDWEYGMGLYLGNKAVGRDHVSGARAYIKDYYTIKQIGDRWATYLSDYL